MGKCDVKVETLLPELAAEDVIVVSRLEGYDSKSEWLRDLILDKLYGRVKRLQMMARAGNGGNPSNSG
jgi:hypothetical protein